MVLLGIIIQLFYRAGVHFDVEFHFENKELGVIAIDFGNDFL